jgi:hypothetical protein
MGLLLENWEIVDGVAAAGGGDLVSDAVRAPGPGEGLGEMAGLTLGLATVCLMVRCGVLAERELGALAAAALIISLSRTSFKPGLFWAETACHENGEDSGFSMVVFTLAFAVC